MAKFSVLHSAPGMWACTDGSMRGTTLHDTEQDAQAYANVQNERAAWAQERRDCYRQTITDAMAVRGAL